MNNFKLKINISPNHLIVLIISIVIILYVKTLSYELIFFDDDTLIYEKFADKTLLEKLETALKSNYLDGKYYRPITLLTFLIESEIVGRSLFIYHLSNLVIHLFMCVILYYILLKHSYIPIVSLLVAVFFAVNPIHINAVGWIAGRGDLLAGFFSISAFYIYLKYISSDKLILLIPVSLLLLSAILSKEVVLIVPFLFVLYYFIEKKDFRLNKSIAGVLLLLSFVTGMYYLIRSIILTDVHITQFSFTTFFRNILVMPEIISKAFIPIGIKALPGIEVTTSVTGIIILLVIISLPLLSENINKLRYYFGLVWFAFLMLPGMVFRTMMHDGFFYWDCRSYLPMIGLIFVIAEILKVINLKKYSSRYFAVIIFYLLILGAAAFIKIDYYRNSFTYWGAVIKDYPDRFLPHIALYNYHFHNKEYDEAESELLTGIGKNPQVAQIRKMLINFYIRNGQKEKAFLSAKDALEHIDNDQQFFIDKFISLSIETNNIPDLEYWLIKYPENERLTERIIASLKKELERLDNAGEIPKAEELKQKMLNFKKEL